MKKFFVAVAALSFVVSAYAQPDGPGLAQLPKLPTAPPAGAPGGPRALTPQEFRTATRAAYNRINNPAEKLDLSSPEATIRSFVWAFWNADFKQARQCVQDSLPYEKLVEQERRLKREIDGGLGGDGKILLSDFHSYVVGEQATVTLRALFIIDTAPPTLFGSSERFHMRRHENNWLIQPVVKPPKTPEIAGNGAVPHARLPEDTLVQLLQMMVDPTLAKNEDSLTICQMNLKQIALGIMQFTQDWDEKFPFEKDWQKQILPYVKNEGVFLCLEVPANEVSYTLNPQLVLKTLGDVEAPAQTIMIYEGKDQKFEYRHGDKTMTNIAFADGHVKSYSQATLDEALKDGAVQWNP